MTAKTDYGFVPTVKTEIKKSAGTQLNPEVVKVFLELVEEGAFSDENLAKDIWAEE